MSPSPLEYLKHIHDEMVWRTAQEDIPPIKELLRKIIQDEMGPPS